MTDSFTVTTRLRFKHGLIGYAIYMRLSELIKANPEKRIAYDKGAILWDLREKIDATVLESVVKDFDLFEVKDSFLFLKDSSDIDQEEKKKRISEVRSLAGKKSAEARAKKKELEKQENVNANDSYLIEKTKEFNIENPNADALKENEVKTGNENLGKLKDYWNSKVDRRRSIRWLCPSGNLWYEYMQTAKQYSFNEIREAIDEALKQQYGWAFEQVIKSYNVSRLLGQASKRNNSQEQTASFEQKELLDYAKKSGKAW